MKSARALPWILLTAAIGALTGAIAARMLAQKPIVLQSGTWLPQPRPLPQFQLSDCQGRSFGNAALHGHPSLLFFGYTYCPDVCPGTLATLRDVQRRSPLPKLEVVFITVDAERDTPAVLSQYLASYDADFIGLRANQDALAPLMRGLATTAARQELPGGNYVPQHSATLYLLDTRGRLAAVFTPPLDAAAVAADLRTLARSSAL